jgi:hypothetical protein
VLGFGDSHVVKKAEREGVLGGFTCRSRGEKISEEMGVGSGNVWKRKGGSGLRCRGGYGWRGARGGRHRPRHGGPRRAATPITSRGRVRKIWHAGRYGSVGVGQPEMNCHIFHLFKHFQLTRICNDSKHIFPSSKIFK